jgi:hypothetical protein
MKKIDFDGLYFKWLVDISGEDTLFKKTVHKECIVCGYDKKEKSTGCYIYGQKVGDNHQYITLEYLQAKEMIK